MDTTTNMQSTAEDYTKPYCIDYSDCSVCEIPIVGKIWCEFVFWKICLLGLEISPNSMFIQQQQSGLMEQFKDRDRVVTSNSFSSSSFHNVFFSR